MQGRDVILKLEIYLRRVFYNTYYIFISISLILDIAKKYLTFTGYVTVL